MTDTTFLPPPSSPPPPSSQRVLRRSRTDRVGSGVAGGLGEYFGVDPVLFRVLFAVSAFFGGAGVLAYLVAWAAIPDEGAPGAPVDRFIAGLRLRRVPVWLVAVVAGLVLWALAFSWWAPGPFFPVMAVVIVLVAVFGGRGWVAPAATPAPPPADATVDLSKEPAQRRDVGASTRAWIAEAKAARNERRRRAFPMRITVLIALVLTLVSLGIADAVSGIRLPVYFWVTLGIVGAGLLVGMALRRTPWSMAPLLIPALAGTLAFGNTGASLHDGVGRHDWTPTSTSELGGNYRLAFGQGTLDLRHVGTVDTPQQVDVTMAAGQVVVRLPKDLNATVYANVRIGDIEVDGQQVANTDGGSIHRVNGYDIEHTVLPPDGASGAPVSITVHLADGQIVVQHS
jgi:phage shock protein PspC (stress-responsive transcriptional regulator)